MKKKASDFFSAIGACFRAIQFVSRNGLAHFYLYPLVLSFLLSMGAVVFIRMGAQTIMSHIAPHIDYQALDGSLWEKTKSLLSNIGLYTTAFLIFLLGYFLFIKIKKYLVIALMSPVLAVLSEKTHQILTGENARQSGSKIIKDIARGIVIAIRNLFMELFFNAVLWGAVIYLSISLPLIAFLLTPLTAIASFAIGSYFFGFSAMDYSNERKNKSVAQSIRYIRAHKYTAIGNGSFFSLIFALPVVGITMSTITCTIAAVLSTHEIDLHETQKGVSI